MSKKYWQEFYRKKHTMKPSPFAEWVQKNYLSNALYPILDIGCGNGRDSEYFVKYGHTVNGMDNSLEANMQDPISGIIYYNTDIKNLSINNKIFQGIYKVFYIRFILHSISEKEETNLLKWITNKKRFQNLICIETRSGKNDPKTFHYQKHKRRLTNGKKLIKKLLALGYDIIYYQESKGLAKYKKEDPIVIRIIAKI